MKKKNLLELRSKNVEELESLVAMKRLELNRNWNKTSKILRKGIAQILTIIGEKR